ncbi:sigma factor [Streptomyces uncialis]|uniref:sigma factor n=1 Tax=Streptomyces uncialis TaxID=1048205 RepID=UPI00225827EC|nr:sigma factor [Streptomyces uncialis]MCX4663373.1 hypothetical protein [Streptomyces uncialis]
MTHLTHAQIAAAKDNDLDAITAVIQETEVLVTSLARFYSGSRMENGNGLTDDLAQAGRITVWECISKFGGETPQEFMVFINRHLRSAMLHTLREETRPGVCARTSKDFEEALSRAGGDPFEAERVAATDEMRDRKMSPERAYMARLAWHGLDYLNRDLTSDDGELGEPSGEPRTLAEKVERETGVPAELINSSDIANHRRSVIRKHVHTTLSFLSERQRHVLKAAHGIAPVGHYEPGTDDAELAADMGVTRDQVQKARYRGGLRFSELYRAGARTW